MTRCHDIDLGYMAVYDDPDEFVQWASGHALDILSCADAVGATRPTSSRASSSRSWSRTTAISPA